MISVLKTKLYDLDIYQAVQLIMMQCHQPAENKLVSATGAHGIITAMKESEFNSILDKFYINLPDGMPAVWIGRIKGAKSMQRCCGADFFSELIKISARKEINHYFCGGKEGVAEKLKEICQINFGNNNIVGTYSPPFRAMSDIEMTKLADDIIVKKTNILWIGLSTPKQEKFAYRLSKIINVNFICTIGAAFDFHTGLIKQAPKWIQNIGMEWFYRLILEPRRLWRRYFEIVPLFIWFNFLELIKGKFFNKENSEKY